MNFQSMLLFVGNVGILELLLIVVVLGAIPMVFFLLTLQNTLSEVNPTRRIMEPGLVWLVLVPIVGLVWQFVIVSKIAHSLKAEFAARDISINEDKPGYSVGLAYCILFCCGVIPFLGALATLAGLVCWIIYWVKINEYKTKLQMNSNILI